MQSKWYELKPKAIELRQQGTSLREVEKILDIPKSTLSGWFKNIILTKTNQNKLRNNWMKSLRKARHQAVIWHNQQKTLRLGIAREQALTVLAKLDTKNDSIAELALAMLYLGEGSKDNRTSLGSTNPLILKFFIKAITKLYGFDKNKIKCELHLRADQNPEKVKNFWAEELGLPLESFISTSFDKRTVGKPTYHDYNGVCSLQCGNIAIQRRLIYLSKLFCEKLTKEKGS